MAERKTPVDDIKPLREKPRGNRRRPVISGDIDPAASVDAQSILSQVRGTEPYNPKLPIRE